MYYTSANIEIMGFNRFYCEVKSVIEHFSLFLSPKQYQEETHFHIFSLCIDGTRIFIFLLLDISFQYAQHLCPNNFAKR